MCACRIINHGTFIWVASWQYHAKFYCLMDGRRGKLRRTRSLRNACKVTEEMTRKLSGKKAEVNGLNRRDKAANFLTLLSTHSKLVSRSLVVLLKKTTVSMKLRTYLFYL